MAFALGFDPAFVGGHHVIRIIAINLVIPFWLRGSDSGPPGPSAGKPAPIRAGAKQGDCDKHRNPDS